MQILEPKNNIIYGPVNSRRLGKSLGVNILPKGLKFCTFNCVYCHFGWTKFIISSVKLPEGISFPSIIEVKNALREALLYLKSIDNLPSYITFSGNGEPTLHPEFVELVGVVNGIKDEFAPTAKTAILSNSTEVLHKEICESLCQLDLRIMKLDCGNPAIFHNYNKPVHGISIREIIEGLIRLSCRKPIYIQTLFAAGKHGNLSAENIEEWVSIMERIKPEMVQIYSLSRGYPEKEIEPANKEDLLKIKDMLNGKGIPSEVY